MHTPGLQRSLPWILALLLACCAAPPPPPSRPPATTPDPTFVAPAGIAVPAGTVVLVRMYDSVDTVRHREGHRWTAILEANLSVDGRLVAPRGSIAYGLVTQASSAGRLAGKSSLTLRPTGLLIGSDLHPIVTGELLAVAESGAARNTAGRTARSAAIGGLIGGSDGARTGARIGLAASLATKDGQIQVPAGTLLEFALAEPMSL